jgi:uncharacterized protein YbjT (DUF2867 family)
MDEPILVTGGTGTLGRVLVERLRARGAMPRVLSRKQGEGRVVGDLATGDGLDVALAGARTILHLASSPEGDAAAAASLIDAARRAGTEPHLVFISIVGIDRIPLPYYRAKLEVERLVEASGLPWTVLRATQFPDLLVSLFGVLARSPVLPVAKGVAFQPVDVHDAPSGSSSSPPVRRGGGSRTWAGPRSCRWTTWPGAGWPPPAVGARCSRSRSPAPSGRHSGRAPT